MPTEGLTIPGIRFWFLALTLVCRYFSRFSDSFAWVFTILHWRTLFRYPLTLFGCTCRLVNFRTSFLQRKSACQRWSFRWIFICSANYCIFFILVTFYTITGLDWIYWTGNNERLREAEVDLRGGHFCPVLNWNLKKCKKIDIKKIK